jgi:hypothetical protein
MVCSAFFPPPPTLEIWQLKALLFPQKAFDNLQALLFCHQVAKICHPKNPWLGVSVSILIYQPDKN